MGRLKKDHSGWRSHGLWLKYQQPTVNEQPVKSKGKKNTRKWCGGKTGKQHELYRYFWTYGWSSKRTNWIRTRCAVCRKEFHQNNPSVPLQIPVDHEGQAEAIQVKVNGQALPLDWRRFNHGYYCSACDEWHFDSYETI